MLEKEEEDEEKEEEDEEREEEDEKEEEDEEKKEEEGEESVGEGSGDLGEVGVLGLLLEELHQPLAQLHHHVPGGTVIVTIIVIVIISIIVSIIAIVVIDNNLGLDGHDMAMARPYHDDKMTRPEDGLEALVELVGVPPHLGMVVMPSGEDAEGDKDGCVDDDRDGGDPPDQLVHRLAHGLQGGARPVGVPPGLLQHQSGGRGEEEKKEDDDDDDDEEEEEKKEDEEEGPVDGLEVVPELEPAGLQPAGLLRHLLHQRPPLHARVAPGSVMVEW